MDDPAASMLISALVEKISLSVCFLCGSIPMVFDQPVLQKASAPVSHVSGAHWSAFGLAWFSCGSTAKCLISTKWKTDFLETVDLSHWKGLLPNVWNATYEAFPNDSFAENLLIKSLSQSRLPFRLYFSRIFGVLYVSVWALSTDFLVLHVKMTTVRTILLSPP